MKIWDKIRIKLKIKKICKVLYQLPEADQTECMKKIVYCLGEVEVDDVAAAPADEVAAALDIAVAALVGADGVGDAARDGRLLGDDECRHAAPPYSEKETEPAAMSATPR